MDKETKNDIEWWFVLIVRAIVTLLGLVLFVLDKVLHMFEIPIGNWYYLFFGAIAIFGDKAADAYAKIKGGVSAAMEDDYRPRRYEEYNGNGYEEEYEDPPRRKSTHKNIKR